MILESLQAGLPFKFPTNCHGLPSVIFRFIANLWFSFGYHHCIHLLPSWYYLKRVPIAHLLQPWGEQHLSVAGQGLLAQGELSLQSPRPYCEPHCGLGSKDSASQGASHLLAFL